MRRRTSQSKALSSDLKRLKSRAYGVAEWAADILQRYHEQVEILSKEDAHALARLHDWIFVPLTLWPFSITDLLNECLRECETGHTLSQSLRLVTELLPDVPDQKVCEAVAEHERHVQRGNYENVVNTQAKFSLAEMALRAEPGFQNDWQRIKENFDVEPYQDHKGVIRRTMGSERNMRPEFSVNMKQPGETFRLAFDAFCLRWLQFVRDAAAVGLQLATTGQAQCAGKFVGFAGQLGGGGCDAMQGETVLFGSLQQPGQFA